MKQGRNSMAVERAVMSLVTLLSAKMALLSAKMTLLSAKMALLSAKIAGRRPKLKLAPELDSEVDSEVKAETKPAMEEPPPSQPSLDETLVMGEASPRLLATCSPGHAEDSEP